MRLIQILVPALVFFISSECGAEVADYPTKEGIYENNGWKYAYLILYKEKKSETRIGILYHNREKVEKEFGAILETPVGKFLLYSEKGYNQGWLNTLTYDRRVFDENNNLTSEAKQYINTIEDKKNSSSQRNATDYDTISFTGTVRYQGLEGGFYGIVSDDGTKYDPINLNKQFQVDGLRINVKARIRKDLVSYHMWGTLIEVVEIK